MTSWQGGFVDPWDTDADGNEVDKGGNMVKRRQLNESQAASRLKDQLAECRRLLQKIRITDGFWNEFELGDPAEGIDRSAKTAADAFQKIFHSLDKAIDHARDDKENIGYFRPLRLMAWEGPKSYEHKFMPLEDFERTDIRPIWLE